MDKKELVTYFKLTEQELQDVYLRNGGKHLKDKSFAVGKAHIVFMNDDATVSAFGDNIYGQCNVSRWKDIVKVVAGEFYTIGLKHDGTVVATGDNSYGQCNVESWRDIQEIFVVNSITVGVKNNGDIVVSTRTSESDFGYNLLDDGTVEITSYRGTNESVSIPHMIDSRVVTKISNSAFACDEYIRYVSIPDSVTNIGQCAFQCCEKLEEIIIPESVKSLGKYVFYSCTNLKKVTISWDLVELYDVSSDFDVQSIWFNNNPKQPILIDGEYYYGCEDANRYTEYEKNYSTVIDAIDLQEVIEDDFTYSVFDDYKVEIRDYNGQSDNVVIPKTIKGKIVTSIGNTAFYCCNIKSVIIPNSVTEIGQEAFKKCKRLLNVTIPDSVTDIGLGAFYGCSFLKEIVLPKKLSRIRMETFYACENLETVVLPDELKSIAPKAFGQCYKLKYIEIPNNAEFPYDAFESSTNYRYC